MKSSASTPAMPCRAPYRAPIAECRRHSSTIPARLALITCVGPPPCATRAVPFILEFIFSSHYDILFLSVFGADEDSGHRRDQCRPHLTGIPHVPRSWERNRRRGLRSHARKRFHDLRDGAGAPSQPGGIRW